MSDVKNEKTPYSRLQLEQLICQVFKISKVNTTISKQISKFVVEYDMSFKDIARCVDYYDSVLKKESDPLYGIWYVPNIKEKVDEFYKKLALEQQKQQEQGKKIVEYQANNIIFNIKNLKHKKRQPKFLDIKEIKIDDVNNNDTTTIEGEDNK